jgi:hypothetical protein
VRSKGAFQDTTPVRDQSVVSAAEVQAETDPFRGAMRKQPPNRRASALWVSNGNGCGCGGLTGRFHPGWRLRMPSPAAEEELQS